ncbi:MAG: terminase [Desulfovibrio sp.]|jgi:hypothetical protein|nr:terminase [Desulfovibrio sp.]
MTKGNSDLAGHIGSFKNDPLGFVRFVFDWGHGDLAGHAGPDAWQADVLREIGAGAGTPEEAARLAVVSGHGVGKSALVAWIILWAMSTRPHLAGVVTANTASQLTDKTWRELALWQQRAMNRQWFKWTATKLYQADHPQTWFVSAVPWSKERPEAFAGLHAEHVLMIFDEASAIDKAIWETAEGAMTTPGAIWCVFGNPTRNSGAFHACFHRMRHRWRSRRVDSLEAKMANKAQLRQWIDDYGEDSDFVRIRVRGIFPRAGDRQLIPSNLAEDALGRNPGRDLYAHAPKILGVDVARFGDDQSVIALRQGLFAGRPLRRFRGVDTMTLAGIVARDMEEEGVDAVFVDMGGVGAGVVDRLHQLGFRRRVMGVDFGAAAANPNLYANKRAEMWCLLKDWLRSGALPEGDRELAADLAGPEYGFTGDKGRIQLEKKSDMKKRGLASPDSADALALTFAQPVRPAESLRPVRAVTAYDPCTYGAGA